MLAYRIVHKKYSKSLIASGLRGRWNSIGKKVIYFADSIPLAFLENMVRRQGVGFNNDFKIMVIQIPGTILKSIIIEKDLLKNWRNPWDYSACQPLGDKWYDEGKTAVLQVPSAVMPEANNLVVNTLHRDFKKIRLVETTDLLPDERIEDILKKYPRK
jgi:RES domain-containing protein